MSDTAAPSTFKPKKSVALSGTAAGRPRSDFRVAL